MASEVQTVRDANRKSRKIKAIEDGFAAAGIV